MKSPRATTITISALALLAAVAVPSAAPAAAATAATAALTAPHAAAAPRAWFDTGVTFPDYGQCSAYGKQAVSSGYAYGWSCVRTTSGKYELWLERNA